MVKRRNQLITRRPKYHGWDEFAEDGSMIFICDLVGALPRFVEPSHALSKIKAVGGKRCTPAMLRTLRRSFGSLVFFVTGAAIPRRPIQ